MDGMSFQEAETTREELAAVGYEGHIIAQSWGRGFAVWVSLEPAVGLGFTTLTPMTRDEWRARIAQCFLESDEIGRQDEARSRETGEPIWYKQKR